MKKYYRLSWNIDSTPFNLMVSILLSVGVMLYINSFIGGMGGIPAFTGFLVVYYLLRTMILSGNRISHQLAMKSSKEVKYLLLNYGVLYLVMWTIMRVLLFLSKFTGWGNVKGLPASEYFSNLYGSTMLEKWAYFLAGILMFGYVMSLFPLVLIRKRKIWFFYALADHFVFMGICYGISKFSRRFIDNELEGRVACVLDDLLLCQLPQRWEAALYICFAVLLVVVITFVVYCIGVKVYGPRPGKLEVPRNILLEESNKLKIIKKLGIAFVGVLGVIAIFLGDFFFSSSSEPLKYKKVAQCLTDDSLLGPMVYKDRVYIPVEAKLDYEENGRALGYLAYLGQDCDSRFYQLAISNVLYRGKLDMNYLQLSGADRNTFERASSVEQSLQWMNDDVFLIWDEDWVGESSYNKDYTGYTECDETFVRNLENQFGEVTYNPDDFEDCDAYFTIRGYSTIKEAMESDIPYGNWVGCIIVKDNNFYYGNLENRISGVTLQQLLDFLGGY